MTQKKATAAKARNAQSNVYRIRELTRRDRVILSNLIEKATDRVDENLLGLIVASATGDGDKPGKAKSAQAKLGLEILRILMRVLNDDIAEWFASLLEVTPEEFDKLPFNIEMEIVKQLREADEVTDFFSGASQQFNSILASKMTASAKKTK